MDQLKRGRLIRHSDRVDLSSLESIEPNVDHRQMIKFSYVGRSTGNSATIVLMNPSSASADMADATIRRVEDVTYKLFEHIDEVRVFNLFTARGMNPPDVNQLFKIKGIDALLYPGTDDLLSQSIIDSDIAIAAWGNPCGIDKELHDQRVTKIEGLLGAAGKLYRIAGGRYSPHAPYPLHGRLWGYAMKPHPYICRSA